MNIMEIINFHVHIYSYESALRETSSLDDYGIEIDYYGILGSSIASGACYGMLMI